MNADLDISGIILSTKRLTLRPWHASDLNDFHEYASVDGVGQMAGWLPHRSLDESREILDMFIREKKTFALEFHGKAIGSIGIERYDEAAFPELSAMTGREIGYVLSRAYWGQGLMPEAVQRVIRFLFEDLRLDFLLVGHFDWNRQSARVIEKCGFRYIKTVKYATQYGTNENSKEYILHNPRSLEA